MRVAALYDVHANLPALQAVLDDVDATGVDRIVFGGDLAFGPFPHPTLEVILKRRDQALFVRGHADREVAGRYGESQGLDAGTAAINEWCADQLSPDVRDFLASQEVSVSIAIDDFASVLFCHGSPRSDEEIITFGTPESLVAEMIEGVANDVVVCGHTHMQFDRVIGDKRVINAGSVGLPYELEPGAYWLLFDPDPQMQRTVYDLEDAVDHISESGCPDPDVLVRLLSHPPKPTEAVQHFETMAGRLPTED